MIGLEYDGTFVAARGCSVKPTTEGEEHLAHFLDSLGLPYSKDFLMILRLAIDRQAAHAARVGKLRLGSDV